MGSKKVTKLLKKVRDTLDCLYVRDCPRLTVMLKTDASDHELWVYNIGHTEYASILLYKRSVEELTKAGW